MNIIFVYKIFPVFVKYTDEIRDGFSGTQSGCVIRIKPGCKDDKGLYEHELTHVKQWYRYLCMPYTLLYRFSRKFRLKMEVEAYKVQVSCGYKDWTETDLIVCFAEYLSSKYNLDITKKEAIIELL